MSLLFIVTYIIWKTFDEVATNYTNTKNTVDLKQSIPKKYNFKKNANQGQQLAGENNDAKGFNDRRDNLSASFNATNSTTS